MVIKRLKGAKFGTDRIARVVTGYALYEEGKYHNKGGKQSGTESNQYRYKAGS